MVWHIALGEILQTASKAIAFGVGFVGSLQDRSNGTWKKLVGEVGGGAMGTDDVNKVGGGDANGISELRSKHGMRID